MATKKAAKKKAPAKKKVTRKKVSKKKVSKKKAPARKRAPRKRKPRTKKRVLPKYEPNEERIERFMHTLLSSGMVADELGEDGKERKRQASQCRQMAVVLDRQFRVFHSEMVDIEVADDGDEDDDE